MNSKILIGAITAVLAATSQMAVADHGRHRGWERSSYRGDDYAPVVHVQPLIERIRYSVPVEQCWTEDRYRERRGDNRTGAAIVGGIAGAVIGHQIGHGDGRGVATVGGALMGSVIGSELARKDSRRDYYEPRHEQVQRCQTRHEERYDERVRGYRVTYYYNGRNHVTELPYDPGRRLRVAVDVYPRG
jgi:uncharacterized protein YcfJ